MENKVNKYCRTIIDALAGWILHHSWLVVSLAIVASTISAFYAVTTLNLNTNMSQMLSANLPYRQAEELFRKTFPQFSNSVLLVVEANTPEMAHTVVETMEQRLKKQRALIQSVYVPDGDPYWENHALLYLDVPELKAFASSMANAQPMIDEISKDPSFSGLLALLSRRLNAPSSPEDPILSELFVRMSQAIKATMAGYPYTVSWPHVLMTYNVPQKPITKLIMVQPKLDYESLFPAEAALDAIHQIIIDLEQFATSDVRIRVTGEVALAHDEIMSVSRSAGIASIMALIMISIILLVGLRSVRLLIATLLTLGIGLALTAGYATLAVGHLNMISVAFAVLFVGLGVDYIIHLCLRYQERLIADALITHALRGSMLDVGPSIALCAVTTAIGFYSFLPTDYDGMAELGLISGTSMFIGMFVSLIVLPALLNLIPLPQIAHQPLEKLTRHFSPIRNLSVFQGRVVRWGAAGLVLVTIILLPYTTFDRNPHNLRNPHSESVTTFNDLLHSESASPLTLSILAPNEAMARNYVSRLKQLDSVKSVLTIHNFIPNEQFGKFQYIEKIAASLPQNQQSSASAPAPEASQIPGLDAFIATLDHLAGKETNRHDQDLDVHLSDQLRGLSAHLKTLEAHAQVQLLEQLDHRLFEDFFTAPSTPRHTNSFGPVTVNSLPKSLQERWVSEHGIYRVQVFPKKDLKQNDNLQKFVDDVRRVAPKVTDLPMVYTEGGDAVIWAFQKAFVLAIGAIFLLLLLVFRNLKDALLVMIPLFMAGMFTAATSVVLDLSFNFANVIALPLLFGLGADNGIHIVHRVRCFLYSGEALFQTSTIRGVILSCLTTILSFSGLAFSSHLGMASMGQFLIIGVFYTLICSVIILPAFLCSQLNQLNQ
ncbi:MAG: hypothetical protein NPIRA04_22310 [Nitrospirales bacterium]|nr:MAG: hypothetical protein NPIRA04_22310 [Nitrospirales bacterium]